MAKQPLLVHLWFHPNSKSARELAQHLHRQLNDDLVVPGLRVPTVFCPTLGGNPPSPASRLGRAERSFVVPLADDEMAADETWSGFIADTWLACEGSPHRCVPMQLSPHAWPLDPRLKVVNFGRAFSRPEGAERNAWVTRRVVIELCRYLRGMSTDDPDSKAPVKLFLSHAKIDMGVEPKVTQTLIDYLTADQPVDAWVDSGDIPTGSRFAEQIAVSVEKTSLLVILTDNYSSREWCREEVMLAKEHQRPIAVIDALMTHEVRSFPFLENVPKLRWNASPPACVDLLLKETLRHLHTREVLKSSKRDNETLFLRPPEPATLLGVAPGTNVLYPDPPLGVGELKRLAKSQVTFTTPLQRSARDCSLSGKVVALSMSESTDVTDHGLDELHLIQTMAELSRHLLIHGATLAYGGHLGAEGYTKILFELVRSHNNCEGVEPFQRIINHRGWPLPKLTAEQRAALRLISTIVPFARPADVDESRHADLVAEPAFFPGDKSPEHRYAWCRGMTEMRTFQSDRARSQVIARVILGGTFGPTIKVIEGQPPKQQWYSSRMPGVLEETLLSIQAGQPVFLIGAFGGAARMIIDLLLGRGHPAASWEYQSKAPIASETRNLYAAHGQKWWYYAAEPRDAKMHFDDPRSIVDFLADAWKSGINPLTREQNLELFETVDLTRMVELVQAGLNAVA